MNAINGNLFSSLNKIIQKKPIPVNETNNENIDSVYIATLTNSHIDLIYKPISHQIFYRFWVYDLRSPALRGLPKQPPTK